MLLTGGGLSSPTGDYETTLQPATLSCGFRSVYMEITSEFV